MVRKLQEIISVKSIFMGLSCVTIFVAFCQDESLLYIDCEDAGWGFISANDESSSAIVQGITIENAVGFDGAGIYINGASPTIRNCRIKYCGATGSGGGIYCEGTATVRLINDMFVSNSAVFGGDICVMNGIDFEGDIRLFGGSYEMGYDEYRHKISCGVSFTGLSSVYDNLRVAVVPTAALNWHSYWKKTIWKRVCI